MRNHTWSSKPTGGKSHDFGIDMPTILADEKLIVDRFGTVERMIERAVSQWTVDVATGLRKRLPNTHDAEVYAAQFVANGSKDTYVPKMSKADAKEQQFTPENLAFLISKGFKIEE